MSGKKFFKEKDTKVSLRKIVVGQMEKGLKKAFQAEETVYKSYRRKK